MTRHLSDAELLEQLEAEAAASAGDHLAGCSHCRTRLEMAREGLALARGVDVPEPPGLFWEAFGRQVARRIAEGEPAGRRWRSGPLWAAAAGLAAFLAVFPASDPAGGSPALLPAWSALPAVGDDPGLEALATLVFDTEATGLVASSGLASCLLELSDEESQVLVETLRAELEGRTL
jgi:anti-sigma factor RsiW